MIKPIETIYRGYRFRSRLEARWAVFFDALRIEWEYEAEGFNLSNGEMYLPDFFLPTFSGGMYCEVKRAGGDFSKAKQFCLDTGFLVWLCEGVPAVKTYEVLHQYCICDDYECKNASHKKIVCGIEAAPNIDAAWGENRMFWQPGYENADGFFGMEWYESNLHDLPYAVDSARMARFEHGETPRTIL